MDRHNRFPASSHWSLLVCIVLALLIAVGGAPRSAHAQTLTLTPSEPTIAAGRVIEFSGSGFMAGERVSMWFTTPHQSVLGGGFASATRDGLISRGFRVPSEAIGGTWFATAYGDVSRIPVIASFEVVGQAPEAAGLVAGVQPEQAPAGTIFAFAATGFDSKEKVSYWITGPDGLVKDAYEHAIRPNADGRVDFTWKSPEDAMPGTWVLTAQGVRSGTARAMPFTIQ
jgi:hypothetical protein